MAFLSKFKDLLLPIPTAFPLIHDGWISLVIAAVADLACVDEPLTKYRQHRSQQMGAAKIGFKEMLMRAKRADASAYLKEADQFRHLYDRLLANSDRLHSEEVLFHLSAKLLHLQARAGLPNHRIMRIPFVLRELLNLRYHRFSRGMHSFAKDLLF
jgi:hypothetical protein